MREKVYKIPPGIVLFSIISACAGVIGLGCMIWYLLFSKSGIYWIYGLALSLCAVIVVFSVLLNLKIMLSTSELNSASS